jgi:hypothetical protein
LFASRAENQQPDQYCEDKTITQIIRLITLKYFQRAYISTKTSKKQKKNNGLQNIVSSPCIPQQNCLRLLLEKMSGSILSLDIHKDRIGLTVASHPSAPEPAKTL